MNVWIVTNYEPLPFDAPETRPQRCGMLAKALLGRGHTVELWTSIFEHVQHVHNLTVRGSAFVNIGPSMSIQFIDGCGYSHDHSPKRFLHNHQTKREFSRIAADRCNLPDIIFSQIPTLELAEAVVTFAVCKNIPVIIDIRDLWPDVYLSMFPNWATLLARYALFWEYHRLRKIVTMATGITAVSKTYLDWGLRHAKRSARLTDSVFPLGFVNNIATGGIPKNSTTTHYNIRKDDFVVTFVGTLSGFNSLRCVVNAARLLKNEQRLRIFIIGDGDHRGDLEKQAKDCSNVILTGWLDLISMWEVLNFTQVGLISYAKGAPMSLPNKPFEYMAAGLPLLSSLSGELENLIRENRIGRIFAAEDPESLAKEIYWFLENPEQTKDMGKRAYQLFTTNFRSDTVYKALVDYMEKIVQYRR